MTFAEVQPGAAEAVSTESATEAGRIQSLRQQAEGVLEVGQAKYGYLVQLVDTLPC